MWFWLLLAKQGRVWSGFGPLKAFFSVQLQNLLKPRRKTSWFCFLYVVFPKTFHFSFWKSPGSSMLLLNILSVVLKQPFSENHHGRFGSSCSKLSQTQIRADDG